MIIWLLFLAFLSCESKHKMTVPLRVQNSEKIDSLVESKPIDHLEPWDRFTQNLALITKDYFRCKGSSLNPAIVVGEEHLFDCDGFASHSLPIRDGEERVEPILLELLNYLQQRLQKKLIITSGHRCPKHQIYLSEKKDLYAKYQVGAQVDFYALEYEKKPEKIIELLEEFFNSKFERYHKPSDVSTPPFYNKEIFVKIYQENEGRNLDNQHAYPYVSIQVRFDRYSKKYVRYNWDLAYKGYRKG